MLRALAARGQLLIWTVLTTFGVAGCGGKSEPLFDTGWKPEGELQTQDFGTIEISDTGDYTGDLEVIVPEGATSTLVHCDNFGDEALGSVWTINDPLGNNIYDGDNPPVHGFRAEFVDDSVPALLPLVPEDPNELGPGTFLMPGSYTFNFWIGKGNYGTTHCAATHRIGDVSQGALLAVELVFVGVPGIDASNASTHPELLRALAVFEQEMATASILPKYSVRNFEGDLETFTIVDVQDDNYSEFNDLLRTAKGKRKRSLTFFMVQEISNASADGATILGLSAGPPGAATVKGTSKSGVVISAGSVYSHPEEVGKIMAHEGGHFLGLFHTTEKNNDGSDLMSDTPRCLAEQDHNGNGIMNSAECGSKGAQNVMWWTLTKDTASFSPQQAWVLHRNPILSPLDDAGREQLEQNKLLAEQPDRRRWDPDAAEVMSVEVAPYIGGVRISPDHEFYNPRQSLHRKFKTAPQIGAIVGWYPHSYLGAEAEGEITRARVDDKSTAYILGGRIQAFGSFPFPVGRRGFVMPFGVAGIGSFVTRSSSLGNDLDSSLHWGFGTRIRLNTRYRLRFGFRHSISARQGAASAPAGHLALRSALSFRFGGGARYSPMQIQIIELFNAYERPPSNRELLELGEGVEDALMGLADDPRVDPNARSRSVTALSTYPTEEVQEYLKKKLTNKSEDSVFRRKALFSMTAAFGDEALDDVREALADSDDVQLRVAAVEALKVMDSPAAQKMMEEEVPGVQFTATDLDGEQMERVVFTVEHPNGRVTRHKSIAEFRGVLSDGDGTWKVTAEAAGDCMSGSVDLSADEGTLNLFEVPMEPDLPGRLDLSVVDDRGNKIPNAEIHFKGAESHCRPDDPTLDNGVGSYPMGPGEYEVVIQADGYALQEAVVVVKEDGTTELVVALEGTQIAVEEGRIKTSKIQFETGAATLTEASKLILDELATTLNHYKMQVKIEGHTDSVGNPGKNKELSQQRADAVRDYLATQDVAPDAMLSIGFGQDRPIENNATLKGRAANRRVDFVIIKE